MQTKVNNDGGNKVGAVQNIHLIEKFVSEFNEQGRFRYHYPTGWHPITFLPMLTSLLEMADLEDNVNLEKPIEVAKFAFWAKLYLESSDDLPGQATATARYLVEGRPDFDLLIDLLVHSLGRALDSKTAAPRFTAPLQDENEFLLDLLFDLKKLQQQCFQQ